MNVQILTCVVGLHVSNDCCSNFSNMYSNKVTSVFTKVLCVGLSFISSIIVLALLVTTIIHAFVHKDLFPNNNAIAISDRKKITHKWFPGSDENTKVIETYLKFANTSSDGDGGLKAAMGQPSNPNQKR